MEILLRLVPKNENFDYLDLALKIANEQDLNLRDYEVGEVTSVVYSYKDEIANHILEHGISSLIEAGPLLEHLVVQGETDTNIVGFFHKYLNKVEIDNELIIIDPYFYHPTNANYIPKVVSIISPYLPTLETLRIITMPGTKITPATKTGIETELKAMKPTLSIVHTTSQDFHDRFWISNNREKGIISGGSLSTYGGKYCLIDRLNTSDVREIVVELNAKGLLP